MRPVPPELAAILGAQCGVVSVQEAQTFMSRKALRHRLATGVWQQPVWGVVVSQSGPLTPLQHLWVAVVRAGPGAVLAGTSAAAVDGLRGYETPAIHVLVPTARQVRGQHDLAVRRSALLGPEDVHPLRRPPRTRLARSLIDAAAWASDDDAARAVLAAGVQQGLTSAAHLQAVAERLGSFPRRRLVFSTVEGVAKGVTSLLEDKFRRLYLAAGIPVPTHQAHRRDSTGRNRWLDVGWPLYGVSVELDGRWHMEVRAWEADLARQNDILMSGDLLLRYPGFALDARPDYVIGQLRSALQARGWIPSRQRSQRSPLGAVIDR